MKKHQIKLRDDIDVKLIYDELNKSNEDFKKSFYNENGKAVNATEMWTQAHGDLTKQNSYKKAFSQNSFYHASAISLIQVERPDLSKNSAYIATIPHPDPDDSKRTNLKDCLLPGMFMKDYIDQFPHTQNFLTWFINEFGGEFARAMFYKLPPKRDVRIHKDTGVYFKDKDRFHLVISGKYYYIVNKEDKKEYNEGDLWWFNNKTWHKSYNHGEIDKINLVFDVYKSNWREMI